MWQGGGEFQTAEGKSAFDSPAVVAALKLWQDAINMGVAPRQVNSGGMGHLANLGAGYCAIQNIGIWAISAMENNAPDIPYGIFKLPVPRGRQVCHRRRRLGVRRQRQGQEPGGGRQVHRLGAGLDGRRIRSSARSTGARSPSPTCRPAPAPWSRERRPSTRATSAVFAKDILPGVRAEPRLPPQVYKIISDAIQQTQLGGADPQATATAASQQLDAFLATYKGAPMM